MDFVTLLGSVWPQGNAWASIIKLFDVGSYAWTIILFTIVLKLVLSPLDFLQRFYTNKQTRMQAKLQPELEKLKKRYGQNQTLLYQKQNELYRKNNVKMSGSCIVMLVYMGVTLTVFLTLFSSLQAISGFKIKNQYNQLQQTYYNVYETEYVGDYLGEYLEVSLDEYKNKSTQEKLEIVTNAEAAKAVSLVENSSVEITEEDAQQTILALKESIQEKGQIEVANKYLEIKDSWLWVKNIWRSDKATTLEISKYDEFKAATKTTVSKEEYNLVMGKLLNNYNNSNQVNGYYVLSVIVVLVSLLSQLVIKKVSQPKGKDGKSANVAQPGFTKILMIIMPFTMLLFTLSSSAIFAIYVIVNSVMTTLITPLTTLISNAIENKQEEKKKESIKVDYRR